MISVENFKNLLVALGFSKSRSGYSKTIGDTLLAVNQSNINATVMKNIKVPAPTLARQKTFVKKVAVLEQKMAEAQAIIDAAPAKKEAIMKKYL